MHVEGSFRVSSILLVAAGFMGLTLAAQIPLPLIVAALGSIVITLAQAAGWRIGAAAAPLSQVSTGVWNVLMVLAFAVCAVDLVWLSQDLLLAGTNFLIVLMINKLFNLHQRKDFLYLYAISFLMLLATAALTVEAWYALVFVSYLLAAIWTLLLYHLKNEEEEHRKAGTPAASHSPIALTSRFFWTTNAIAFLALIVTLAIFFVTPRAGAGFFQKGRGQPIRTSGFSQKVDLGVIGNIKLDPTVVMRVDFPDLAGPSEARVYLQGAVYDHYTGRSWVNTLSRRRAVGQIYTGSFLVSRNQRAWMRGKVVRQEVLIEALDVPVLFGVSVVQRVRGNFPLLQADDIGGLHLPYPPSSRFQYTVFSIPNALQPKDKKATAIEYPPRITSRFLQLPPLNERVAELSRAVTKDAATLYEKALAVKWYLLGNYRYSLDVGQAVSDSPVEDFLFDRKTGYCEHYATAMVLMLRSLGIPARLVTGFMAGEWNDFGHYYTVRQQDAHAWVEVYFPRSGWIILDPTPSLIASPRDSPLEVVARLFDSFRVKWTRFVIQYSFRDQQAVLHELRERSQPVRSRAAEWLATAKKVVRNWRVWVLTHVKDWDWMVLAGWIAGGLTVWIIVVRWMRRRRIPLLAAVSRYTPEQLAATRFYARMLELLERRGLSKPPTLAPFEYARSVAAQRVDTAGPVGVLTDLYCRGRFSSAPLSPDDLSLAERLLDELGRLLNTDREQAAEA